MTPRAWTPTTPPPPTNRCPEAPLGGGGLGGGALGGAIGGIWEGRVGGAVQVGQFGVGGGVRAPKTKRWSITGSPYLPLPYL